MLIRKHKKIFLVIIILLFLGIIGGGAMALNNAKFQTYLTKKWCMSMSEKYKIDINISNLNVKKEHINIKNIYIEDHKKDTLLYIKDLHCNVSWWDILTKDRVKIKKAIIKKGVLRIKTYKGEELMNIDIWIEKMFPSGEANNTPFLLEAKNIDIEKTSVVVEDFNYENPMDAGFYDIYGRVTDFEIENATIKARTKNIKCRDHFGLTYKKLALDYFYGLKQMRFDNGFLQTNSSKVHFKMRFDYPQETLSNFKDRVKIHLNILKSQINSNDLRKFYEGFGKTQIFDVTLNANGTLNDFNILAKNIKKPNDFFTVEGLYRVKNWFSEKKIEVTGKKVRVQTDRENLVSVLPVADNSFLNTLEKLGKWDLTAKKLTLFSTEKLNIDFELKTDLGTLGGDIKLDSITSLKKMNYEGGFYSDNLKLTPLLDNKNIGVLNAKGKIKGKSMLLENLTTHFNGVVQKYQYLGYNYQKIDVNGDFSNKRFKGILKARDPNIEVDFECLIDFSTPKKYNFDFAANVIKADFKALHLWHRDTVSIGSGQLQGNVYGTKIDDLEGFLVFQESHYQNEKKSYDFGEGFIRAQKTKNGQQQITIKADSLATGIIKGNFKLSNLANLFFTGLKTSIYKNSFYKAGKNESLEFSLQLENNLINALEKNIETFGSTKLKGALIQNEQKIKVNYQLNSPKIKYNTIEIDSLSVKINNQNPNVNTHIYADKIKHPKYDIQKIDLFSKQIADSLFFRADFTGGDKKEDRFGIDFYHVFENKTTSLFAIKQAKIYFNKIHWNIQEKNKNTNRIKINYNKNNIYIENILAQKQNRRNVKANIFGLWSKKIKNINVKLENIIIEELFPTFENFALKGVISGNYHHTKKGEEYTSEGFFNIKNFTIDEKLQGNLMVKLENTGQQKNYGLEVFLQKNNLPKLYMQGFLFYENNDPILDLRANFNDFQLETIDIFSGGILNFEGKASGELKIIGKLNEPSVFGNLELKSGSIEIPYLNTKYEIKENEKVIFKEKNIIFENTLLTHKKTETKANIKGLLTFENITDWYSDLTINTDRIFILDTEMSSNNAYYGKAFLSGSSQIKGAFENINISADVSTLEGTDFYVVANAQEIAPVNQFKLINFKEYRTKKNIQKKNAQEKNNDEDTGFSMDLNINVLPKAKSNIVIDNVFGSYVKANGTGQLKIDMDKKGALSINGDVIIRKGNYNFSYQGIINKSFNIQEGSKISWTKDPYNAKIDIKARHRVKANASALFEGVQRRNKIDVDLIVTMKGDLNESNQTFDIEIPNADAMLKSELDFRINTNKEGEKMRHFFSLLLSKSFYNSNNDNRGNEIITGTTADILSRTISNIINQDDNVFQIGVGYTIGDRNQILNTNNINDQLNIMVSSDISERVSIEGSLGVPMNSENSNNRDLMGSVNMSFYLDPKNRLKWYIFNRPNNIDYTQQEEGYTRGTGFSYQINFKNLKELFKGSKKKRSGL